MDTKKLVTIIVIVAIVAFIGWQAIGMFGSSEEAVPTKIMKPNPDIPKSGNLVSIKPPPAQPAANAQPAMTEREQQLLKLQQDTQARYIAAVNELQMLKVQKEIAETNKDINKAKLDSISSQKDMVDLLSPKAPTPNYAQGLDQQGGSSSAQQPPLPPTNATPPNAEGMPSASADTSGGMKVISISRIRGQWMAVLGYQGALYSVKDGDVIPNEGSTVISIQRDSVTLEKDKKQQKLSMVQII